MWEAVAIVCFVTIQGQTCVTWRDDKNPYPSFEACDEATDAFLRQSDNRLEGFGRVHIRAGCLQSSQES